MKDYSSIKITHRSGDERFHFKGKVQKNQLVDFWRWHASDLITNSARGVLAEYIVAMALGLTTSVRINWDACDLLTKNRKRIEVKSASYIQAWFHKKLSTIRFGIRPTRYWDPETNVYSDEIKRQADVYVLCLLNHKDQDTLDPMDLSQWTFFVLSVDVLNQRFPKQKSIGLSSLKREGIVGVSYADLSHTINKYSSSQG